MRRSEREIVDFNEIEEILHRGVSCRLALSLDDKPYIVSLSYGYDNMKLYFHSAPVGKKVYMIDKNPQVCFQVDVDSEIVSSDIACKWSMKYRSVVGSGTCRRLTNFSEKSAAFKIIMNHYDKNNSYSFKEEEMARVALYEISIDDITGKKAGY